MEDKSIPSADPRLVAILDRLSAFDRAKNPLVAKADLEASAIEDIRYLVTQLWNVHHLRSSAQWALRVIREYHGECPGCSVCDCEYDLEGQISDTDAIDVWPCQPDVPASLKRNDNLLVF
jgi:hypothetical protein